MPHKLTTFDRVRIEGRVWALDQRLYDLPRRSRVDKRREVRANLLEAAADQGAGEALRRLGNSGALARDYLGAEFGDRPRHSWVAATAFAVLVPLVMGFALAETSDAYARGLTAANPAASGTFAWSGVSYLQNPVTFTVDHGQVTQTGGAWGPLVYVLLVVGTVACGRLWRLLPTRPHRPHRVADGG